MMASRQGSFHLFRAFGIDVYLHWSWFLIAAYEVSTRSKSYGSIAWNLLEYVSLFVIVLLHEFGHSLACRQVGGRANQIILWPLGGIAYVEPPQRPGAVLWSLAAGPLVNVILAPILLVPMLLGASLGWADAAPNAFALLRMVCFINIGLLIFNMLPIYPLDGGQILRALLWFAVGRARSLKIASMFGFVGVAALIVLALIEQSIWIGIIAGFILLNCWSGLRQARALAYLAEAPRHIGFACPACHASPPRGQFWICGQCKQPCDIFETNAFCPRCGAQFSVTRCLDCGNVSPIGEWVGAPSTR